MYVGLPDEKQSIARNVVFFSKVPVSKCLLLYSRKYDAINLNYICFGVFIVYTIAIAYAFNYKYSKYNTTTKLIALKLTNYMNQLLEILLKSLEYKTGFARWMQTFHWTFVYTTSVIRS